MSHTNTAFVKVAKRPRSQQWQKEAKLNKSKPWKRDEKRQSQPMY